MYKCQCVYVRRMEKNCFISSFLMRATHSVLSCCVAACIVHTSTARPRLLVTVTSNRRSSSLFTTSRRPTWFICHHQATTTTKLPSLRIEVLPTALWTETQTLTLTFDAMIQQTSKRSRSKVTRFKSQERKRSDGRRRFHDLLWLRFEVTSTTLRP